jgi:hypothetical protein
LDNACAPDAAHRESQCRLAPHWLFSCRCEGLRLGLTTMHSRSLLVKMHKHALLNSLVDWEDGVTLRAIPMSPNGASKAQIRDAQSALARPGIGPLTTGASR